MQYPLGHGSSQLLQDPVIGDIAQAHGKSAAQVVLRWHIQMGFCPVPGSKSPAHMHESSNQVTQALKKGDYEKAVALTPQLSEDYYCVIHSIEEYKRGRDVYKRQNMM